MLVNKNLERFLLTRDTTISQSDVSTILKRTQIIVKQDSIGGHKVILGAGLAGDVPINMQPNSITLIVTLVADDVVYCYSELSPTYSTIGGGSIDAYTKTESNNRFYPLTLNPAGYATESYVLSKGYLTNASFANYWTKAQADARYLNQTGNTGGGTNDYNQLINKPFIPTNNNQLLNGAGFITGYTEVDTLDTVLGRGNSSAKSMNVSGRVSLTGELVIPSTPSNLPNSIWLSVANSTGNTSGGSGVSYLAAMLDVAFSTPLSGQALIYNGNKWTNQTTITDLSAYYTSAQSNSLFKNINYVPSWNEITSRPTSLSQFNNDTGFITGYVETDTLNSVLSRGNTSGLNMSVSGNVALTGELVIPSTPSNTVNAIWLSNANSTGSTGGGSGVSYLSALLDTQISSPLNGQSIIYDSSLGKWKNSILFGGDYNGLTNKPDLGLFQRYNTFTGDANTVPEHTNNFTYAANAPYVGSLQHFGANGYGLQLNSNYGTGVNLAFRTKNGDAGTWNNWYQVWTSAQFTYSVSSVGNSVVQRDANGYIQNTYINTTDDVNGGSLGYIVGKLNSGDNYHRSFTAGAVQSFLGLGSFAYRSNIYGSEVLTDIGNATVDNGVAKWLRWSNYGNGHVIFDASSSTAPNGAAINNANSQQAWTGTYPTLMGWNGINTYGVRVDSSRVSDTTNETWDAMLVRNPNAYRNVYLHNGASLNMTNDGAPYYTSIQNQRGDIFHKYISRNADGATLDWKENWWDGTKYHTWSTDSLGFVANSKLTTVSSGDGSVTYQGSLEVRGVNAGITFHYPGNYAAPLYINSGGVLNWHSGGIATNVLSASNSVYGSNYVHGGRIIAGYDSGLAGSVNADNWFRSNGNTGWYNSTYGSGVYMEDSTWVRVYGGKGFLVQNEINGNRIVTVNGFKSTTHKGLAGDYDTAGTTDKIIWTIGDSWDSIGNHYGLGYSYNSPIHSANHQIVGRHGGSTTFSLNLTTGGAYFTGAVYAPHALIIPTTPSNIVGAIWVA
ncbi:hypothetical protein [Pedobacter aquatilis]|uniref:hypothetical protein n=1 Tax=Pedobacter aquatilis TaxID=351343 RepID=UPI00292D8EE4|nr:hypothetical protein [Pedobacter aquatilis]